jgi:tetratricopeptide (TPR) repeat protein
MDFVANPDRSSVRHAIELLYRDGFRLHKEERYIEASALFRTMLRVAPTDERGWLALGDCHEKLGQRKIALELYSAGSVAADPAPLCLLSRFRTLYDMSQHEEARRAYGRAFEIATAIGDETLLSRIEKERSVRP